jgi:hypothetical protein
MNPKIDQLICIWDNIAANRNPTHQLKCIWDDMTTNNKQELTQSRCLSICMIMHGL